VNKHDKLAADVAPLDPRLRVVADSPDCFLCGRKVRREVALTVETAASIGLHCHAECCHGMQAWELTARYWQALRAAIQGGPETPNPGPPRVQGDFV
jgi:hypothetical protein